MSTTLSIWDRLLTKLKGLSYMTNGELRKISRILITHHYDGHHISEEMSGSELTCRLT